MAYELNSGKTMDDTSFSAPRQVASEIRRLAGTLYPKTSERPWAEIVDALEHCARRIEDLASAILDSSTAPILASN